MATVPQNQSLPLFYSELAPLSSQIHANYRVRPSSVAPFLANVHAVPLTVEEFPMVQRYMPIVFSLGDDAVPLGLFGLNEGVNVFFDGEGTLIENNFYVPAYIRRYPYLLARLRPDSEDLSLCFDPTSPTIGAFEDGEALFNENGEPTELTQQILQFAEQFEMAGQRTTQFMQEIRAMDILIDGEISIQPEGAAQPFIYRGFQMVDEKKLSELRGDQMRKMAQSGMLPLIYAHLFSMGMMSQIFERQLAQGKVPGVTPAAPAVADAG